MKIIYHYDEKTHKFNGHSFIDEGVDEEIPKNTTVVPLPSGLYSPVFNIETNKWENGLSDEEISDKHKEQEKMIQTGQEKQKRLENAPFDVESLGQLATAREIEAMEQGQKITNLEIEAMVQGQQATDFELRLMLLEANGNV